jgi:hypothetical protein
MSTTQQLTEAKAHRDAARSAYNAAATKKASREAAEELEFWIGKVAFLGAVR